jgi:propanediol dehydratase small subunit
VEIAGQVTEFDGSQFDFFDMARTMRETFKAERIAAFIEEAAVTYENRGIFTKRY